MNRPAHGPPEYCDALAVAFAAVLPTVVTAVYFVALTQYPTGVQQTAWGLGKLVQFAFPAVWVLAVRRTRPKVGRRWWRGWGEGLASGTVLLVAMLSLYHLALEPLGVLDRAAVAMNEKLVGMGLDSLARYLAFAAFLSVAHSLLEEYYFRWFVFGQMRKLLPFGLAVVLSSLAFAAHHVLVLAQYFGWTSPLMWLGVVSVGVGGAYWAWHYERSGSLFGPWISHLLADVAILAVGYELLLA